MLVITRMYSGVFTFMFDSIAGAICFAANQSRRLFVRINSVDRKCLLSIVGFGKRKLWYTMQLPVQLPILSFSWVTKKLSQIQGRRIRARW